MICLRNTLISSVRFLTTNIDNFIYHNDIEYMGAKNMKKIIITTCGAILIGFLMISSATALPKVNSDPLMNIITEIEQNKKIIEEEISSNTLDLKTRESINLLINKIKNTIYDITLDVRPGGLIDLLLKIIEWLITFIQNLINLIGLVADLAGLIYNLLNVLATVYNLIMAIIDLINQILNPETFKTV